jgi:hypothetical protein
MVLNLVGIYNSIYIIKGKYFSFQNLVILFSCFMYIIGLLVFDLVFLCAVPEPKTFKAEY